MTGKRTVAVFMISIALIAAVLAFTGRMTHAQSGSADGELMQKVDQIAADQKAIMADLAGIKEQLRILTIRVTQQQ